MHHYLPRLQTMLMLPFRNVLYSVLAAVLGCGPVLAAEPVRFDRDIRPILSDKCFHCHGPDEENRAADLRLDVEEAAKEYAVVPGETEESELLARIFSHDIDAVMPPQKSNKTLSDSEKNLLRQWIAEGAAWSGHWAFTSPAAHAPPELVEHPQHTGAIDRFVLANLEQHSAQLAPPAARSELLRRLTFDLTGLPPTLRELDDFLSDSAPDAYERVVDRLLASQHYGERMAVMWLDAARYGDTSVYHADGPRDMWGWRDAIVAAYNQNMPFDEFSINQIAGDLIPDATNEQRVLSGFNRNNGTTDEGGAIAEEYRVEYAVDRVKTTSTTWLGLTMECAQCHDHKYDPISQREYYQFYAFFNVSADGGMQTRNGNAAPTVAIPNPENEAKLPDVRTALLETEQQLSECRRLAKPSFESWLAESRQQLPPLDSAPQPLFETLLLESKGKSVAFRHGANVAISQQEKPKDKSKEAVVETEAGVEAEEVALETGQTKGMVVGPAKWQETPFDHGLEFDGKTSVDFGDVANFERDQAFSYGGWIKPTAGVGAVLARMDDADSFRGYDLYAGASPVSVHIIHTWPDNAVKVVSKKKLKADEWVHVFATYDGSSKAAGIKIYVNGEVWDWNIEQDCLSDTIRTSKTLLLGSRHPGSKFSGVIDSVQVYDAALSPEDVAGLYAASPIPSLLGLPPEQLAERQAERLESHYLSENSDVYPELVKKKTELAEQIVELEKPLTTVMMMSDQEKPRETFILNRGAYDSPTETRVTAGTPAVLPALQASLPPNRLGLAQWMFAPENPLTARVAVNRYWQMLFGIGLVDTPGDFGAQGSYPSHPELLDWLARDFQDNGWDVKRTLKQIVMSRTYRQSSSVGSQAYAADPNNRRLARGSRFRLQAEFLRDMALSTSGLLDKTLGGPGVKPYQPPGLWAEVGLGGNPKFVQDHGQALYRRSLYTYWKRSAPPPAMQVFDAPTREKCTLLRPRTNTPLQALVVLNDPQYVEAARNLAQRVLLAKSDATAHSDGQRVGLAFRMVSSRFPSESELTELLGLLSDARQVYAVDAAASAELIAAGESPPEKQIEAAELAAWTIVTSTILNLDESLTRP